MLQVTAILPVIRSSQTKSSVCTQAVIDTEKSLPLSCQYIHAKAQTFILNLCASGHPLYISGCREKSSSSLEVGSNSLDVGELQMYQAVH